MKPQAQPLFPDLEPTMTPGQVHAARSTWMTPRVLGRNLVAEYNLGVDLYAAPHNALCPKFITKEDDADSVRWDEHLAPDGTKRLRAWANPPHAGPGPALDKAYDARRHYGSMFAFLLPESGGIAWFVKAQLHAAWWVFDARVHYVAPKGVVASSNTRGSVLFLISPGIPPGPLGMRCSITGRVLHRWRP